MNEEKQIEFIYEWVHSQILFSPQDNNYFRGQGFTGLLDTFKGIAKLTITFS